MHSYTDVHIFDHLPKSSGRYDLVRCKLIDRGVAEMRFDQRVGFSTMMVSPGFMWLVPYAVATFIVGSACTNWPPYPECANMYVNCKRDNNFVSIIYQSSNKQVVQKKKLKVFKKKSKKKNESRSENLFSLKAWFIDSIILGLGL